MRNDICALAHGDAGVRANQFFGGNDTGAGNIERGDTCDVWLAGANFGWTNQAQAFNAVRFAAIFQCRERCFFGAIAGYDELPGAAVRDVMLFAKLK